MDKNIINKDNLAGFSLCGYIQDDNSIKLGNGQNVKEFPKEIYFMGNTYVLENLVKGGYVENKGVFVNAEYV